MRKRILFIATFLFTISLSFAQEAKFELGKVPTEDLAMMVYELDSTANAVILNDYCSMSFSTSTVKITRKLRIKILRPEGLEWGTFEIPHLTSRRISVKGMTINSGGVSKIKNEHRQEEVFYDDLKQTTITFPDVKVGSVLDIEYSYNTSLSTAPLHRFAFQREIPVRTQELHLFIPDFYSFNFRQQGYHPIYSRSEGFSQSSMSFGSSTIKIINDHKVFFAQNMPAFRKEPFSGSSKNHVASLTMQINEVAFQGIVYGLFARNWETIESTLLKPDALGKYLDGNTGTQTIANSLTIGASDLEKAQILAEYVRKNYTWNERYSRIPYEELNEIIRTKEGNSGALNILYLSLLRAAGVTCYPVLASTRSHGRINMAIPLTVDYNHLLAYVKVDDNQAMLVDVTHKDLPFDMLPYSLMNETGRILSGNGGQYISLTNNIVDREIIKGELTIGEDGTIIGTLTNTYAGFNALDILESLEGEGESARKDAFLADHTGWSIVDYDYTKPGDGPTSVEETCTVESYDQAVASGDRIYFNALLGLGWQENPYATEDRKLPIDLGVPINQTVMLQITLPEGYEIEEMPQSQAFALPNSGGTFRSTFMVNGNMLTVISKFDLSKPYYTAQEFGALNELVDLAIAQGKSQVVLKKTE